jgi:cell division septation protein DedD
VEVGLAPVSVQFLPHTVPVPLFVVQAGAFSNPDNAVRVQQQLAPHYPRVQIVQRHDGPDTLHRVWLGKFASRGRAEQIATQVQDLGFSVQILPLPQPEEASTQSANQL